MDTTIRRFDGCVALVTGAASGIGRATGMRLAGEGARVALVDLNLDGARTVEKEIESSGGCARAYECDVASSAQVIALVQTVERELGPVDILANVAGTGDVAGIQGAAEVPDERWNAVLAVNLSGPFFLCRAVLPGMVARGRGAIVNVSSLA